MTKADLLAALATVPDSAEIHLAAQGGCSPAACIIRAAETETWIGDRSTLAEELAESDTRNPAEAPSLLWHDPAQLPPAEKPDVVAIALTLAKFNH